jgi:hypothetical protein
MLEVFGPMSMRGIIEPQITRMGMDRVSVIPSRAGISKLSSRAKRRISGSNKTHARFLLGSE